MDAMAVIWNTEYCLRIAESCGRDQCVSVVPPVRPFDDQISFRALFPVPAVYFTVDGLKASLDYLIALPGHLLCRFAITVSRFCQKVRRFAAPVCRYIRKVIPGRPVYLAVSALRL